MIKQIPVLQISKRVYEVWKGSARGIAVTEDGSTFEFSPAVRPFEKELLPQVLTYIKVLKEALKNEKPAEKVAPVEKVVVKGEPGEKGEKSESRVDKGKKKYEQQKFERKNKNKSKSKSKSKKSK